MATKDRRGVADISSDLFRVAALFTSRDPLRPALHGVRIHKHPKKGVMLIGTDGRQLIAIHDERGWCRQPMTLDARTGCRAIPLAKPNVDNRWRIGRAGAPHERGFKRVRLITETYPDYSRVLAAVRANEGGTFTTFNPDYIASFAKAAKMLPTMFGEEHRRIMVIPGEAATSPTLFLFPHAAYAIGVLMPMYCKWGPTLPPFARALLPRRRNVAANTKRKA